MKNKRFKQYKSDLTINLFGFIKEFLLLKTFVVLVLKCRKIEKD